MSSLRNLTRAEYFAYIEDRGHKLHRDGDYVDIFVLDYGCHNGPGCEICGESWCHHCRDEVEMCEGKPMNPQQASGPYSTN